MAQRHAYRTGGPDAEPVSLNDGIRHLRLQFADATEGDHVQTVLAQARQLVEDELQRQLITAEWRLELDAFPGDEIILPRPPCQTVEAVQWQDADGAWHDVVDFRFVVSHGVGRALPPANQSWPTGEQAVRVDYVAGYGDGPDDVPGPVKAAILLWASTLYEQPDALTERPLADNPAIDRLLAPYRAGAHQ